ncbi:MAG: MFS transporter [Reichenbachiella sp.]
MGIYDGWSGKGTLKKNRIAVSLIFLVNGMLYASWTSRMPELKDLMQVSNAALGTLLFSIALGAVIAMPVAGWLTIRYGSAIINRISSVLFCMSIPLLLLSPFVAYPGVFFFLMGVFGGGMDITMNGQAVLIERKWLSPILSSFHGLFSIGMMIGAGVSTLMTAIHVDLTSHFVVLSAIGLLICVWAASWLVPEEVEDQETSTSKESGFTFPSLVILPIGIIAFCAMIGEGSTSDWSALFMMEIAHGNEFMGALTVGFFATAMTLGRLIGDHFTQRYGKFKMLVSNSMLSIVGFTIVVVFITPMSTLIGFFIAGLGLSNVVPIIYSVAGNTKGVSPSAGIAMVSTIGYAGFFIGPPAIGWLSDWYDLRIGLLFSLLLLIIMLGLILVFRKRLSNQ